MEPVRSFIAIELSGEFKKLLSDFQSGLKTGQHAPVKWTDPYGIHLTLKFLGNISPDRISEITVVMADAAGDTPAFYLEAGEPGAFPNLKRVQVIWVGIGGDTASVGKLQRNLEERLAPLGFPPETRPFRPHLTVARVRDQASAAERYRLGELIAASRLTAPCSFRVANICLMKSQLTREGAVYSRISLVELAENL